MLDQTTAVQPALTFLTQLASAKEQRTLAGIADHDGLIRLAQARGFEVTRDSLAAAMEILVDRRLEQDGIPSWVRSRAAPA